MRTICLYNPAAPHLNGKDIRGNKTFDIVPLYEAAKNGGGFETFYFNKPGENEPSEKLSYSAPIPNTNDMWVGTAIYTDNLATMAQESSQHVKNIVDNSFYVTMIIAFVCLIAIILFIFVFYEKIQKSIKILSHNLNILFDNLAHKDNNNHILQPTSQDELGQMGLAINENIQQTKIGLEQDAKAVEQSV
ncbi:chemotaxis protein, partial [Helicobacter marmotae]